MRRYFEVLGADYLATRGRRTEKCRYFVEVRHSLEPVRVFGDRGRGASSIRLWRWRRQTP
jgi:hypothetical protein